MIGDTAELAVKIKLDSQGFTTGINKAQSDLTKLNKTATGTGSAFKAVAGHIGGFQKNIGRAFSDLGKGASTAASNIQKMAFAGAALAVGGGIAAVKWAGDFEAQLRTINTIARATPEGLNQIGDSIREIAKTTGTPLEELTQGYYDLLSAGIKAADAQNVLTNANKLAIGGLASAAETVDLLTTAINVYGGDASQAGRFTDEFAKAIERGKVTAAELAASYAMVAPLAKSLGIENKELAAGYATLTAAGTPAAEAATQMASAMTALLKTTPGLEALQKQTKKNYAEIAGSQGLNVALQQMTDDAAKAGVKIVDLVGRKEALLYILQTTGPNLRKYNADLAAMGNAAGTAADQMAERQQGLNYQLSILKAGIKDAGITIGSALIPKLVPLIQHFNEFLTGHQDDIKRFGSDLANAFQSVAEFIQKIDFSKIADSLKVAGGFAKGLIQAFLGAPTWLQEAVVTGWGLNKLTGGAVQNIMADLTKAAVGGFMSQFLVRGSNPANPLFVADVTGGFGGVAGAAGGIAGLGVLGATGVAAAILGGALIVGDKLNRDVLHGQTEGNQFGPGVFQHPTYQRPITQMASSIENHLGKIADDLIRPQMFSLAGKAQDDMANAVARGTERGIVHSGVFQKAQTVREAAGAKLSLDVLRADLKASESRQNPRLAAALHELAARKSDLKDRLRTNDVGAVVADRKRIDALNQEIARLKPIPGKALTVNDLVTGQAIALAQINRLRMPGNDSPDLKSAAYNLRILQRLQSRLPADLAAKLTPKIASLEAAINRTTQAVRGISLVQLTQNVREGNTPVTASDVTKATATRSRTVKPHGPRGTVTGPLP